MADVGAVQRRIWSLLEPYSHDLESATIYGMPSLRWPGAKAHDYFAAVRPGKSYVSLYLLVADTYPDALAGAAEALLKRRTGKAASPSRSSSARWRAAYRHCLIGSTSGIARTTSGTFELPGNALGRRLPQHRSDRIDDSGG